MALSCTCELQGQLNKVRKGSLKQGCFTSWTEAILFVSQIYQWEVVVWRQALPSQSLSIIWQCLTFIVDINLKFKKSKAVSLRKYLLEDNTINKLHAEHSVAVDMWLWTDWLIIKITLWLPFITCSLYGYWRNYSAWKGQAFSLFSCQWKYTRLLREQLNRDAH